MLLPKILFQQSNANLFVRSQNKFSLVRFFLLLSLSNERANKTKQKKTSASSRALSSFYLSFTSRVGCLVLLTHSLSLFLAWLFCVAFCFPFLSSFVVVVFVIVKLVVIERIRNILFVGSHTHTHTNTRNQQQQQKFGLRSVSILLCCVVTKLIT